MKDWRELLMGRRGKTIRFNPSWQPASRQKQNIETSHSDLTTIQIERSHWEDSGPKVLMNYFTS